MNILIVISIAAIIIFIGTAANDAYLGKKIDIHETKLVGQDRELEMLLKVISDLGMDAARQKERADMLEDKSKELEKKLGEFGTKLDEIDKRNLDAEKVAQEIIQRAEESAKEVEKQWNDGLQNMLGWNPFNPNDAGGGT
jgi:predicted RNase H-like nuclease (RuvC/YqgF family)